MNKYFENPVQTGKFSKSWPVKNSQKLKRLWKNKPYGAGDGTMMRSEVIWKPIMITLEVTYPWRKDSLANIIRWVWKESCLEGSASFGGWTQWLPSLLWGSGDEGSTPRRAWTPVVCWDEGSRASKITITWGCDGICVHLEKQDVLCGFAE